MTPDIPGWQLWLIVAAVVLLIAVIIIMSIASRKRRKTVTADPYTEGLNLLLAGRHLEAIGSFTEAIRKNTGHIDAYLKLGGLYRQMGKPRRAIQIHRELVVRSDLSKEIRASIYRESALDLEQIGNIDKAKYYLDLSQELYPDNSEGLQIQLRLLEKQNKWKEVGNVYNRLAEVEGKTEPSRQAFYKIAEGRLLTESEKGHEGRLCYKEALKLNPESTEAMLAIAESYMLEDRQDDALEWLSRLMFERPEAAHQAFPMVEKLLYEQGRFSEIESLLRKAVNKEPSNISLLLIFVNFLVKKREVNEAMDLCYKALQIAPDDIGIRLQRLRLLKLNDDNKKFDRELDELIHLTSMGRIE